MGSNIPPDPVRITRVAAALISLGIHIDGFRISYLVDRTMFLLFFLFFDFLNDHLCHYYLFISVSQAIYSNHPFCLLSLGVGLSLRLCLGLRQFWFGVYLSFGFAAVLGFYLGQKVHKLYRLVVCLLEFALNFLTGLEKGLGVLRKNRIIKIVFLKPRQIHLPPPQLQLLHQRRILRLL